MRILFAIAHIGNGGGQVTQSMRIVGELAKNNEVLLLTLKAKNDFVKAPCKVEYAGEFKFPSGIFKLAKAIRKHSKNFDVMQCFDGYYSFPAAVLARKKPYFLRMGMDPASFLKEKKVPLNKQLEWLQMLPVRFGDCSRFIVNSPSLAEVCKNYKPIMIKNGYEMSEFTIEESKESIKKRLGMTPNKLILIYHGKITPRKNLESAFVALQNPDLQLYLIGEVLDRGYLGQLTTKYKMFMERVTILPEVRSDMVKYYLKASDIFIHPSAKEGSPNSLIEAMASGLPVVCSRIESHDELIQEGINGFLFETEPELRHIIDNLVADKKLREEIGKKAKAYAFNNHDIRDAAKKYLKLYEGCLR